jgi:hypothetical protein
MYLHAAIAVGPDLRAGRPLRPRLPSFPVRRDVGPYLSIRHNVGLILT